MQLGGNAAAVSKFTFTIFTFDNFDNFLLYHQRAFFAQHNCTSTDAQQKYKSRTAMQYREKLSQASGQAMKRYGNKVRKLKYYVSNEYLKY